MNRRSFFQIAAGIATACKVGLPAVPPTIEKKNARPNCGDARPALMEGAVYSGLPDGITWTNPGCTADPNFIYAALTVQRLDSSPGRIPRRRRKRQRS